MKKKILSLICVALLATGCLCSCGDKIVDEKVEKEDSVVSKVEEETEDKKENTNKEDVKEEEKEENKDKKDPILDLMGEKMVTLGDLKDAGLEYRGYAGFGGEYEFTYTSKTTKYAVKVNFPQSASDAMRELSIFDDNYEEKQAAILAPLVVLGIEITSGDIIPDEALAKYIEQPASVMIDDGFEVVGYVGSDDEYSFYFAKDGQSYSVTLDSSVVAIMDETGDYENKIISCVVKHVEYDGLC